MLVVKELRSLAANFDPKTFEAQLGPFALVERPASPDLQRATADFVSERTVAMSTRQRMTTEILAMLSRFDDLLVVTLPPMREVDELTVGRTPDCDLVIEEPTVSKHHALLRWGAEKGTCTIQDLGSSNGTYVNAQTVGTSARALVDGDVVSFGDAQFMYFLAASLQAQLNSAPPPQEGDER